MLKFLSLTGLNYQIQELNRTYIKQSEYSCLLFNLDFVGVGFKFAYFKCNLTNNLIIDSIAFLPFVDDIHPESVLLLSDYKQNNAVHNLNFLKLDI